MSSSVDAAETRRLAIQKKLDGERTQSERNQLGQFATPYPLAVQVVRYVKSLLRRDKGPIHFADPGVGAGAVFSALLSVFPHDRIASATGIEIDSRFARAASDLWASSGLEVIEGDFTDPATMARSHTRPNLVLTNPPYVRHHHISQEHKVQLQHLASQATGLRVNGLAGLYVYFLLLAHEWMEEGGLAAWLIPSEFMDVNYGAVLRRYLTEKTTLIRIHRFDPHKVEFDDALVTSAVVVFRKEPPSAGTVVDFSYGGTITKPERIHRVRLAELKRARKWTTYPQRDHTKNRTARSEDTIQLGDLFRIQRGIATGANRFFILPREETLERGFPDECLHPILPSPRHIVETIIERDDDGYPEIGHKLAVIDSDLPEEQLRQKYPRLWSYLETAEQLGIRDRYLLRQRNPWYKQERRAPPPFLCTYMGRGANGNPFRFLWNRSDAIAPNVYLMLYPIRGLAQALKKEPELHGIVFEFLNQIGRDDLQHEGRVYGGGLYKIEPRELEKVAAKALLTNIPSLTKGMARQRALWA